MEQAAEVVGGDANQTPLRRRRLEDDAYHGRSPKASSMGLYLECLNNQETVTPSLEMSSSTTRIAELATLIADNTATVDSYLKTHNLPTPSFDPNGPLTIPIAAHETEIVKAQDTVVASTQELHNLIKGPTEMLMGLGVSLGRASDHIATV